MSTGTMTPVEAELHEPTAVAPGVCAPGAPGTSGAGWPPTRSGLSLDLPPRLLDEAFGPGWVVRFEELDLPPVLTHEPTRRFLLDVGLPEQAGDFTLDLDAPLRTPAEYAADEGDHRLALPPAATRLLRLGGLAGDGHAVLDGTTGTLLRWTGGDGALTPLETDVAAFAFTLWQSTRPAPADMTGIDAA
ncbi:SUKH-4 family immunity protein [Streptomyces thermoalcalitolerans]|uniref:SUKH-4 immunity protein of toxin-antitoxin system n=1 Tax=Streptomyces thermoalcalitolerans TaxID=65605 RepID=A0ABP4AAR3_9ACTN